MPARKAIEMGRGTILVSLPKDWVRRNGIKKGADLSVEELSPGKLMVRAYEGRGEEQRQMVIEHTGEDIAQVVNDVTGAYLLGYDLIKVAGTKLISRDERQAIKDAMKRLVGLEILDEDSRRITLQFLLEPTAITPEKIVRRMSGLLDGMLKDTADALAKGDSRLLSLVSERDDEVDRLYFLLVRATRAAVVRAEVAERYGLSPIDLLDYRVLATFLESAGDAVSELSEKLREEKVPRQLARGYLKCVARLKVMNELATQGFLSRRAGKTRTVNSQIDAMAREITSSVASISKEAPGENANAAGILASLERVSKLLVDVSDLAVITQQVS
ncbi:MAG: phosphate uptake regulator PhoU [Nitrososphaerota archaeon]|nr:phosphate uptake regulator PhoU [Nitrososphaerota archaeon]MDG6942026.1 phosphate uptake regulator PhoU [Nitrososphaerota archaeon]MDG6942491.1 phosphate uptake regulator PhoU [Nitrososphaerota archaeon]MDG6948278.1 phosphate uptake regulator PhoU [Nitrososphaerota archaeon]